MGRNFTKTDYGKVGDIIYPANNDTNGFWQTSRWDLVTKVTKTGLIIGKSYIWDWATARAIQLMQEVYELREKKLIKSKP